MLNDIALICTENKLTVSTQITTFFLRSREILSTFLQLGTLFCPFNDHITHATSRKMI